MLIINKKLYYLNYLDIMIFVYELIRITFTNLLIICNLYYQIDCLYHQ
jgi:hypothetical protein